MVRENARRPAVRVTDESSMIASRGAQIMSICTPASTGSAYQLNPGGFTGYLCDRLAWFCIGENDTLTAQLATLGYSPSDVSTAILSHLHQDHIGGLVRATPPLCRST
jgi:glyoxylase-like metal-dependent hydrolase (beta-lactamase superfamily II)